MFRPSTISQAMGLTRLQEDTVEAMNKKNRGPMRPATSFTAPPPRPQTILNKPMNLEATLDV